MGACTAHDTACMWRRLRLRTRTRRSETPGECTAHPTCGQARLERLSNKPSAAGGLHTERGVRVAQAEAADEEMEQRGGGDVQRDQRAVKPGYESDEEPGSRHRGSHRTPTPQPAGPSQTVSSRGCQWAQLCTLVSSPACILPPLEGQAQRQALAQPEGPHAAPSWAITHDEPPRCTG